MYVEIERIYLHERESNENKKRPRESLDGGGHDGTTEIGASTRLGVCATRKHYLYTVSAFTQVVVFMIDIFGHRGWVMDHPLAL